MFRMAASLLLGIVLVGVAEEPAAKKPLVEPPLVRSLSFSPDGALLAATVMPKNHSGIVVVWSVADRKLVSKYDRAGESPSGAFAAGGKSIAFANGGTLAPVLDPKTGQKIGDLGPFAAEVMAVVALGPGRWVTRGKDNVFRVWDEKDKKVVGEFALGKRIWDWAVSPSGKWLFANGEGVNKLWDLAKGEEVEGIFKTQPGRADSAAFLAEDRLLLGSNYGSHRLVELPAGKELMRFKNEGGTGAIVYSPKAEMLACRYYSSPSVGLTPLTFRPPSDVEKTKTAALLKDCDSDDYPKREKAAAALVELGPAIEPLLKTAMADGPSAEVRMRARVAREAILNKPKHQLRGHQEEIRPMVFSPDGRLFVTGGADGLVILWDPVTGKEITRFDTGGE